MNLNAGCSNRALRSRTPRARTSSSASPAASRSCPCTPRRLSGLGRVRVGSERGWRQGAKRRRVQHPASLCNAASAPFPVQPGGPGPILQTRGAPFVVAGSLCGLATRPRRRLNWRPDLPRRGPVPSPTASLTRASRLAGDERFEQAGQDVGAYARAGVGDVHQNPAML